MAMEISDVQKRVEAALEEDERTADYAIEVVDQNGLVTLKGKVSSVDDKQAAEEIADAQEGVIGVTNALVVVGDDDELLGIFKPNRGGQRDDEGTTIIAAPVSRPTTPGPTGSTAVPRAATGLAAQNEESSGEEEDNE